MATHNGVAMAIANGASPEGSMQPNAVDADVGVTTGSLQELGKRKRTESGGEKTVERDDRTDAAASEALRRWVVKLMNRVRKRLLRHNKDTGVLFSLISADPAPAQPGEKRRKITDVGELVSVAHTRNETVDDAESTRADTRPTSSSRRLTNITEKIECELYCTLEEVFDDLDRASVQVLRDFRWRAGPGSEAAKPEEARLAARVQVCKERFTEIILREKARSEGRLEEFGGVYSDDDADADQDLDEAEADQANFDAMEAEGVQGTNAASGEMPVVADDDGAPPVRHALVVEALVDGTVTPLWASLERPLSTDMMSQLPPGVRLAQIHSSPQTQLPPQPSERKRSPTLGEWFPPAPTLPTLSPPRPLKLTSTRSQHVGWYNPADPVQQYRMRRRSSQGPRPVTTGHWLSYGPPLPSLRPRERAPSSGEGRGRESQELSAAAFAAREEALWFRAYSSHLPTHDDAGAVIPHWAKNEVWWDRIGRHSYERYYEPTKDEVEFAIADIVRTSGAAGDHRTAPLRWDPVPAEERYADEPMEARETVAADELAANKPAANEPTVNEPAVNEPAANEPTGTEVTTNEIDSMLEEISGLIETLHSYNRRRHLTLPPRTRSTVPQEHSMAALVGTPTTPMPEEVEIYKTLKAQLAVMVGMLPPYAVARLNGDQLAELNISTMLRVDTEEFHGILDPEPEVRAEEEAADSASQGTNLALDASLPTNVRTPTPYSVVPFPYRDSVAGYAPQTPRSSAPRSGQYYPQQMMQAAQVPATHGGAVNEPQGAGAAITYQQPRASRPSGPRKSSGSAAPSGGASRSQSGSASRGPQQYFQQPAPSPSGSQALPAAALQMPSMTTPRQRPSQPRYQQAAQQRLRANAGGEAYPHPFNPGEASGSRRPTTTPRAPPGWPYPPSRHPTPQQQQQRQVPPPQQEYQWQAPGQGPRSASPAGGNVGADGWHTYMSPERQSQIMERNRMHVAAAAQHQARQGDSSTFDTGRAIGGNHSNNTTMSMGSLGSQYNPFTSQGLSQNQNPYQSPMAQQMAPQGQQINGGGGPFQGGDRMQGVVMGMDLGRSTAATPMTMGTVPSAAMRMTGSARATGTSDAASSAGMGGSIITGSRRGGGGATSMTSMGATNRANAANAGTTPDATRARDADETRDQA